MATDSEQQLEINRCPIWPEFPATGNLDPEDGIFYIDSARAGCPYFISPEALEQLEVRLRSRSRLIGGQGQGSRPLYISEDTRKKLTTWSINQSLVEGWWPTITPEVISSVRSTKLLLPYERSRRLLRFIADETPVLGTHIEFDQHAGPRNAQGTRHKDTLTAFAWSESSSWLELNFLLEFLIGNGWLQQIYQHQFPTFRYRVTVDGHTELGRQATATDSNNVFVAMWFDKCVDAAYDQGIEPAIRAAGYNPVIIRNVEHTGQIEDRILAEIRKSKFIVADLTQGHAGTRGGVYFEAGFAYGLGLDVIYTCRRDKFHLVHFDTNHQAQILWNDYADLKTKLQNRIEGAIGRGPLEFEESQETATDC